MATLKDVPILNKAQAEQAAAELPPAGFARNEELAQRKDDLQEALETKTPEAYTIDPKAVDIEREIAYHLNHNELEVLGQQEGFRYCWTNYQNQTGKAVMEKKRWGWVVVSGNDPEAQELKAVDGTRRLGDVLLMRIPEDKALVLDAMDAYRRQRQQDGVVGGIRQQAEKTGGAIILHENDQMTEIAARRAALHQQAYKGIDKMLRDGSVPGLPNYPR